MTTVDELMALSNECGIWRPAVGNKYDLCLDRLRAAIEQALSEARADERERCAKVCEIFEALDESAMEHCAAAIRKGRTP